MSVHEPQMRVLLTAGRNGFNALFLSTGGHYDLHGALSECLMLERQVEKLARCSKHTFLRLGCPRVLSHALHEPGHHSDLASMAHTSAELNNADGRCYLVVSLPGQGRHIGPILHYPLHMPTVQHYKRSASRLLIKWNSS